MGNPYSGLPRLRALGIGLSERMKKRVLTSFRFMKGLGMILRVSR